MYIYRRLCISLILFQFIFSPIMAENTANSIYELRHITINGCEMTLLIRSENINNPVLLYLHGGPGDSLIPFAEYATDNLIKSCTVVYWDQRGTGLSYSNKIDKRTMNVEQFVKDTEAVTQYLKTVFSKKKIFLLGHSWGSILGLLTIKSQPENYYAYIGVGQVINNDSLMRYRNQDTPQQSCEV